MIDWSEIDETLRRRRTYGPMKSKEECGQILDSGNRREFDTGAVRDIAEGKGRMDLVPLDVLMQVSKIFEAGCKKYGDRNWEKGINLHAYLDSGLRHLVKWEMGQLDEPHFWQALWNFLCLGATYLRIKNGTLPKELNDLPWEWQDSVR